MTEALQRLAVSPLAEESLAGLRATVTGYSAEQLVWASGYLAGLAVAGTPSPAPAQAAEPGVRLTILYGSQTGNGRAVASELAAAAERRGVGAELVSMADFPAARLKRERLLAIIISTHGEGDPPDDAMELHRFITGRRLPTLNELGYWVLALGDSSYENFCQTGREFDARLAAAGAQRLAPMVECDLDYATAAESWTAKVLDEAEIRLGRQANPAAPQLRVVPPAPRFTKHSPFEASLLVNQRITGHGSTKDVRHLELDLQGSGLRWEPGDSLGVAIRNPDRVVDPVLDALGLSGEAVADPGGTTLREALIRQREVTALNRSFLDAWAGVEPSGRLAARLDALRGNGLGRWMQARHVVDVLREFPAEIEPAALLQMLRPLAPRLYSIASAPEFTDEEVHLTVSLLSYEAFGRPHWGAGSSWLVLDCDEGDPVPVYVESNERFRLPADDVPIVMIGPGTGVAPFRAFLQARAARGATGRNWLLFGDRNFATDFLYQSEWLRYRKQGLLHRLDVAFSRDQADKRYVQHRMREEAAELYRWLDDGAHLYVCGDASAMAPDVDRALHDIIVGATNCDEDGVEAYLAELRRSGRYQRDVY